MILCLSSMTRSNSLLLPPLLLAEVMWKSSIGRRSSASIFKPQVLYVARLLLLHVFLTIYFIFLSLQEPRHEIIIHHVAATGKVNTVVITSRPASLIFIPEFTPCGSSTFNHVVLECLWFWVIGKLSTSSPHKDRGWFCCGESVYVGEEIGKRKLWGSHRSNTHWNRREMGYQDHQ